MSITQLPVKNGKPYILVVGTPFNGLIPYGPFDSKEAAIAWGDRAYPVDEWHIVPLERAVDPYEIEAQNGTAPQAEDWAGGLT